MDRVNEEGAGSDREGRASRRTDLISGGSRRLFCPPNNGNSGGQKRGEREGAKCASHGFEITLFVLALVYGFGTRGFTASGDPGVALVPIGLAAALALLSAGIALSGWRKQRRGRGSDTSDSEPIRHRRQSRIRRNRLPPRPNNPIAAAKPRLAPLKSIFSGAPAPAAPGPSSGSPSSTRPLPDPRLCPGHPALHRGDRGTLRSQKAHDPRPDPLRDPAHLRPLPGHSGCATPGRLARMRGGQMGPNVRARRGPP